MDIENDILYIVIPAYNEEATIGKVLESWYNIVEKHNGNGKSKLIIINDGSKDNTYKIACSYKDKYKLLEVIDKKNSGHGATILYGYNYAIKNGATYIFQTDSDGQTEPKEFEEFWNERKNYDMVIGHRKHREDGLSRIIVTNVLKMVLKLTFGVSIIDANSPFRLMNANTLKKYINLIPNDFNLSNVMISVIYAKFNLKVKYIPISFRERQGGINSINIPKIIGIGKKAFIDFTQINKNLNQKH